MTTRPHHPNYSGWRTWRKLNGCLCAYTPAFSIPSKHCGAGSTSRSTTGPGAPGPRAPASRTGAPEAATPRGLTLKRSRSDQERAPRTPKLQTLPLTGVGACHSDPSRLSARPFPGRLPAPAHGPLRGTAAPRTGPCAGVPSQQARVFSGPARGPRIFLPGLLLPQNGFLIPGRRHLSVPAPSVGFVGSLGVAFGHWVVWAGQGSLAQYPSSAPVTHASGPSVILPVHMCMY